MRRIYFFTFLISILTQVQAQHITGSWSGELEIMGNQLPLVFHISQNDTAWITKMDSPAQHAFGLPTTKTIFSKNRVEIVASGLGIFYQGRLHGDTITGTFNQGGIPFPLTLTRDESAQLKRPQEPVPPFEYLTENITFPNKNDKINLAATVTLPKTAGKYPAVILIAGSGANDRDETIFGHKPFWVIADFLTQNGFIVLRYDKRGVGESEGSFATATTKHFAEDAASAITYLKSREDVDKSAIGLIGHSEGGIIAPMIASENQDVSFIVLLAGMGVKGIDLILDQNETLMTEQQMEPENIVTLRKANRDILETLTQWKNSEHDKTLLRDQLSLMWDKMPLLTRLKSNKEQFIRTNFNAMIAPWYKNFLIINPTDYLQKVQCPVLIVNGEKDSQVLFYKNIPAIRSALERGGNKQFTVKTYPHLNHLFQECKTGSVDEYAEIEQTVSPQLLEDMLQWMKLTLNMETHNEAGSKSSPE